MKLVAAALPAVVVFAMGFDNGAYSLSSRSFWAIGIWWAVILLVALGGPRSRAVTRPAVAVVLLLAALALLALVSGTWGSSAERATDEANRISLYVGVLALVSLSLAWISRARWCDGLAAGITGVAVVALVSRFAPDAFSDRGVAEVLPGALARLSFPVGYWNGLAILAALAVPLLLRTAVAPPRSLVRAAPVAVLPAAAAVIYLASSRGGYGTAVAGALAFLVLSRQRWWAAAALVAGGVGSAVAVTAIARRPAFANDPQSALADEQAAGALLFLVVGCVLAAGVYGALLGALRGRTAPARPVGIAAAAVAVVAAAAGIVAADPAARVREFTRPPPAALTPSDDFVRSHLLSANGSGRWQFWETGLDAFREQPLLGHGAGSYEAWWAQHGSLAVFVRDAHSAYVETLAELGFAGFVLLAAVLGVGLLAATGRARRPGLGGADETAAATAVVAAYAVALGIDWMWELTVVSVVGFACLAVALAPEPAAGRVPRVRSRPLAVGAGLVAAWLAICLQAVPFLSEGRIRASQEAAARGDAAGALEAAEAARAIQPWAATPRLQVALVREELGQLPTAAAAIAEARRRDPDDWRLWLVSARLQAKLGDGAAARASLERARELNPRSPLFARPRAG